MKHRNLPKFPTWLPSLFHSLLLHLTRLRTITEMPTNRWFWQFCEWSHKVKCRTTFLSPRPLDSHSFLLMLSIHNQLIITTALPLLGVTATQARCWGWDCGVLITLRFQGLKVGITNLRKSFRFVQFFPSFFSSAFLFSLGSSMWLPLMRIIQ